MKKEVSNKNAEISARLSRVIEYLGETPNGFAKKLEYDRSQTVYDILNMKSAPSYDFFRRFSIAEYSEIINFDWFLTGKGTMLLKESNQLNTSENNIEETRPRIPMNAAAGSLSVAIGGVTNGECEQYPIIRSFPRYDFTIFARGDSMTPEFHSGDEVACLFVTETKFIQWGRPHILDTAQGVILKRIFDNNDCVICKSNNPEYGDFPIPKEEIYNLALVIGLVRRY